MNVAFVLGNGVSRQSIELEPLKSQGTVYGCNALYREFDPNYLVAVDIKMVLEIAEKRYQHKIPVWTNPNKAYSKITGLNYFNPSKGWSSGPTALWLASEHKNTEIYILGFDYQGIGVNNQEVNNMYAGTLNYKRKEDRATYFGNWLKQTYTTIKSFNTNRYIRVVEDKGFIPKEFEKLTNLEHILIADFKKKFSC